MFFFISYNIHLIKYDIEVLALVVFLNVLFYLIIFLVFYYVKSKNEKLIFIIIPILWFLLSKAYYYINYSSFLFELTLLLSNFFKRLIFNSEILSIIILELVLVLSKIISLIYLKKFKEIKKFGVFALFLILILSINAIESQKEISKENKEIEVTLIQGNFFGDWLERVNKTKEIFSYYRTQTLKTKPNSLVVWPEYSLPIDIFENKTYFENLIKLSKEKNITLIVGHIINNYSYIYDAASVFDKGKFIGSYLSKYPVYFNGNSLKGDKLFILEKKGIKFGIIICYEELNRKIFEEYKDAGVDAIISLTNEQRISATRGQRIASKFINLRAKEFKLYIIRATNTGITKIVNKKGEEIAILPINKKVTLRTQLQI